MRKVRLTRKLRLVERPWPWAVLAVLIGGVLLGVSLLFLALFAHWRGHSTLGVLLGLGAVALAFASALYSARKRLAQESRWFGRGTMVTWLWIHVWLGILALAAAGLHAGFGLLLPRFTTGWLLMASFVLLVGSGVLWRLVYRLLPPAIAESIGNYAVQDSVERAKRHGAEIAKRAAGQREEVREAARSLERGRPLPAGDWTDDERAVLEEIQALSARRRARLDRIPKQRRATVWLQAWRLIHIPAVALFLILLPVHLVAAFEIAPALAPATLGFQSSVECAECHAGIVEQWSGSMHAHGMRSPVMIVQNNLAVKKNLPDELARVCVNCHGPTGVKVAGDQALLPLEQPLLSTYDVNEGVGCSACHQFTPARSYPHEADVWANRGNPLGLKYPNQAIAGHDDFQDRLSPGWTQVGRSGASGNSAHQNLGHDLYDERPWELCGSCHNVVLDKNGDGLIEKGPDLVLQTLHQEFEQYRGDGGALDCIDCHMPASTPTVDNAWPFINHDLPIPRTTRSHVFAAVDYPLDRTGDKATHRAEREALLQSAANIAIVQPRRAQRGLEFDVSIQSLRTGHNLPSGFAFARQMWLEVVVSDQAGRTLFTSGVLADDATSDLCDAATLAEPLMQPFVQDCGPADALLADRQLVNYQGQLVNNVEATGDRDNMGNGILRRSAESVEIVIQELTAGAVGRKRPSDGQVAKPLVPPEVAAKLIGTEFEGADRAVWAYRVSALNLFGVTQATIRVRLRFRNLPPYFLRAMDNDPQRTPADGPEITPLVDNLQVIDMEVAEVTVEI